MRLPTTAPSSRARRSLALAGAGLLVLLAGSPGAAAEPVAQADASGLVLTVLGVPVDSGTIKATHDGITQVIVGQRDPLLTALGDQPFIDVGTLAQDATGTLLGRDGRSAACAGLAGDGASLLAVEEGFCLAPGANATINAGTLQLPDIQILQTDLLAGLDQQLQTALQPLLDAVLPVVQDTVTTLLTALGEPGIVLDLGAVQSRCTATPSVASGVSQLTDVGLAVQLPTLGRVDLVSLPADPDVDMKVLTDLDQVIATINGALQAQLATPLGVVLGPVGQLLDELVTALNDNVVAAVADELAPLEENVLDATLNRQTGGGRSIEVTALDLRLLPAAADLVDLVDVQIGRSSCGANARLSASAPSPGATDTPTTTPDPTPTSVPTPADPTPDVPTSVPAGELDRAGAVTQDGAVNGRIATGVLVLLSGLAAAGGALGFRRVLRS